MKALLQQAMQQIKFDQELARLLTSRSDAEQIIQKLKLIFEQTLDDHTELYWKKEHAHTKTQLECSIQECLNLRHDLREMDDERTNQLQVIKEQNKQIDELQLTLGEIEQKLNLMQENVLAQKQELTEEFELNLNQIQDSYKQKEEQQIKQLEAKLTELEQVVSDQQNALRKEREIAGHINNDTKQIKQHLKCEQETTTNLRQQMQVLKKTNETLNIDKQCLENRSKQLKQQNETLHKQVRSLETKIIDLSEECVRFKKKSQHEQSNYKSQQSEQDKCFKRKIRNYKLQVGDMKNKLKAGLQKIFANLKLEMDSFKLQALKEIQQVQISICQMINKSLKSDYELKERDFSDKMEQIRYSMQAHFKVTLEKQASELEYRVAQQKNEYEQIIKNLKQQIQQLEEMKNELENDLQIRQVECEEHQLQMNEKSQILNDQQKQLQELSDQAKDQLNLLMEQDENIKQLMDENSKLQKKTLSYEELVSKQAVAYQSTKVEDKIYKKQYEDINQSNQHLRKQIQILQEQQQCDQNLINKLKTQASTGKLNTIKDVEDRHLLRLQYIRKI